MMRRLEHGQVVIRLNEIIYWGKVARVFIEQGADEISSGTVRFLVTRTAAVDPDGELVAINDGPRSTWKSFDGEWWWDKFALEQDISDAYESMLGKQ